MRGRGRGGGVQPCAPIRELEWPLVWNNQPLNIPIFWRLCRKIYRIQVTLSELGAQVKHAYVNFVCRPEINLKTYFCHVPALPGSLYIWPRPEKRFKAATASEGRNKVSLPLCSSSYSSSSFILFPLLLLFLYDTGLKKPRLPDINPSYFTVEGDVNRTLAVRAAVRPHRSHSHYTPTPRRCKSFVLEANAWSPASKGSQARIINILPDRRLPRYR